MSPSTVGVALLGILALGALSFSIFRVVRSLAWIVRLATSRGLERQLASPPRGERVILRGRVEPIDLVGSSLSEARGVYVRAQREEWRAAATSVQLGGAFHVVDRVEEAAPFKIAAHGASVLVDPAQGVVDLPPRTWVTEDGAVRCTETVLEPGADVIVIGRVRDEGGFEPSAGYRGVTTRPVMGAGEHGLRILAVRSFMLSRALGGAVWLAIGTVASGVTFGTMVWIGNHHPLVTVEAPGERRMSGPPMVDPYAVHLWRGRVPDGAEIVGPARIEIWVLGMSKPSSTYGDGERIAFAQAQEAFWERQLDGMSPYRERRRREWLVFEVIEWSGTAFREPEVWERFCSERPWLCEPD
jgi:hypothetical protein